MEENEENAVKVEIDLSLNKAEVTEKIKNVCFLHFSTKKFDNSYISKLSLSALFNKNQ